MEAAHEVMLKKLIKQMVTDACTDEQKILLARLDNYEIGPADLTEPQKNAFRQLVHRAKWDIDSYVSSSSRGNLRTNWEIIIQGKKL